MALEGTLKDFPLPDIIQLLSLSRKTGAVEITGSGDLGSGRLYFESGRVVSATLRDLPASEAAYAFFSFPSGDFRFHDNEPLPDGAESITTSNEFLIIEGLRRADEWAEVCRVVPSLDLVVGLVSDPVAGQGEINLKPAEWRVLTMINGRDTVREVARRAGASETTTAGIIAKLVGGGLVTVVGPRPSSGPEVSPADGATPVAESTGTLPSDPEAAPVTGTTAAVAVPVSPAARPARPARASGITIRPSLYARLEGLAVGELGTSGRLLLGEAYRRIGLHPGADLTVDTAGRLCDQFEYDAEPRIGSAPARALADSLRRVVAGFFGGA